MIEMETAMPLATGDHDDDFQPPPAPPGPPPLLSEDQLLQLALQGWLSVPLPESLSLCVEDLFESSSAFFNTTVGGGTEKAQLYPAKQGTEFGYYEVANEKEYVTFRCRVRTSPGDSGSTPKGPAATTRLEDSAARAWHESGLLLFRILVDIARESDLDLSVWDDMLDGTLTMPESEREMTYTLMRLFQYLPTTGFAEEHTDLGLLTLCVGDNQGLQVLDLMNSSEHEHVWADAAAGTRNATVLVGQTLKALAGGTMNAGVHRVVGNPNGRLSVVFALRHSQRHDVDLELFGGQGKVDPRQLWMELKIGKVNINTTKKTRDAQRAKLAAAATAVDASPINHPDDSNNQYSRTGQG